MHVASLGAAEPFITKDGSEIRELVGPATRPADHQSLAEATVPVGAATEAHFHKLTEELYFIVAGAGRIRVDDEQRDVAVGDCIVIAPGCVHTIANVSDVPLKLLCCCAPAYSHDDTYLVGPDDA